MAALDPFHAWNVLEKHLPRDFRELANEHKQVQTQFGNAKITTAEELLRFLFAHVQSEGPLRQTVAAIEAAGGPRLSAMRLHMKLRQAGPYLHALLGRLVAEAGPPPSTLEFEHTESRYEVLVLDAADVVGPGSTCAPARVHVVMNLGELRVIHLQVTDLTERDGLPLFKFHAGQLVVVRAEDTTAASIEALLAQGAHVVVFGDDATSVASVAPDGARVIAGLEGPESTAVSRGGNRGTDACLACDAQGKGTIPAMATTLPEAHVSGKALAALYTRVSKVLALTSGWKASRDGARLANQREDTTLSWLYAKMILGILQAKAENAGDEEKASPLLVHSPSCTEGMADSPSERYAYLA